MKTISKIILLSVSLLAFISCQNEIDTLTQSTVDEVLQANSETAILVAKTVSKDGSKDNIVDKASCISINFPFSVQANGIALTIENEDGLELIEQIFDNLDDDNDLLEIVFPIVITLGDFTEVTINNLNELENFTKECPGENEEDDDIECVDFVYPITMSKYDSENQLIETVSVESDRQFYRFMNHLNDGHVVGINFPITMVLFDGTEKDITNMNEFRALMQEAAFMCDEDDDNDYDDDDCMHCSKEDIVELLLECNWSIHKLILNDQDNTDQYREFLLKFFEDGTVKALVGNEYVYGTWEFINVEAGGMGSGMDGGSSHNSSGTNMQRGKYLNINFEDFPDFSFKWMVYEKDDNTLDLRTEVNRFKLEKTCDSSSSVDKTTLVNALNEGIWEVALFENKSEDETLNYNGFSLDFKEDFKVTATKDNNVITGEWAVNFEDDNDTLKLELFFGETAPFSEFNENWWVVEMTDIRIEVKYIHSETQEITRLILERL
tara:strand:- start:381 stop:1862 length:1482 start_codon:yes stop_codon:yes gene_type:complete